MSQVGPPQQLDQVRVVLAFYNGDPRVERVDVIDVRSGRCLQPLLSLDPDGAVQLAHHLFEVAGWARPVTDTGS